MYVALKRGPLQDVVHTFAKALATELASRNPKLMTVGYRVAARPKGRVVVDYKQNAWGQTLASIYSVRPKPRARRCRRPSHGRNWRRACASKISGSITSVSASRNSAIWKPPLAKERTNPIGSSRVSEEL